MPARSGTPAASATASKSGTTRCSTGGRRRSPALIGRASTGIIRRRRAPSPRRDRRGGRRVLEGAPQSLGEPDRRAVAELRAGAPDVGLGVAYLAGPSRTVVGLELDSAQLRQH